MMGLVGNARNGWGGASGGVRATSLGLWEPDFCDDDFEMLFGILKRKSE